MRNTIVRVAFLITAAATAVLGTAGLAAAGGKGQVVPGSACDHVGQVREGRNGQEYRCEQRPGEDCPRWHWVYNPDVPHGQWTPKPPAPCPSSRSCSPKPTPTPSTTSASSSPPASTPPATTAPPTSPAGTTRPPAGTTPPASLPVTGGRGPTPLQLAGGGAVIVLAGTGLVKAGRRRRPRGQFAA